MKKKKKKTPISVYSDVYCADTVWSHSCIPSNKLDRVQTVRPPLLGRPQSLYIEI